MRICPHCLAESPGRFCPNDGYHTVDPAQQAESVPGDPLIGAVIEGRYRIDEAIGQGGMGTVYRATQLALQRRVAIKVVRRDRPAELRLLARFEQEARAIAALQHPHIVALHDFGVTAEGVLFFVMEYLVGEHLADMTAREGPLPEDRCLVLARQILDALAEAHAAGIIHRDLKPQNVFLIEQRRAGDYAKLLDFGVAKILSDAGGERIELTQSGLTLGSPLYMPPEQAAGQAVGPAADLYAFGAILYEMLTGAPVFMGRTTTEVLMAHAQRPVPWPTRDGAPLEGPLADLSMACLRKEPGERPASADEAMDRLAGVVVEVPAVPRAASAEPAPRPAPAPPAAVETCPQELVATDEHLRPVLAPQRRWSLLAAAALLVASVATLLIWLRTEGAHPPRAPRRDGRALAAIGKVSPEAPPVISASPEPPAPQLAEPAPAPAPGPIVPVRAPAKKHDRHAPKPAEPTDMRAALAEPLPPPPAVTAEAPPPQVETHMVTIMSEPAGATVWRDGQLIAPATPAAVVWPKDGAPPVVQVRYGALARQIVVSPDDAGRSIKVVFDLGVGI